VASRRVQGVSSYEVVTGDDMEALYMSSRSLSLQIGQCISVSTSPVSKCSLCFTRGEDSPSVQLGPLSIC
jgi:hypothetical protein